MSGIDYTLCNCCRGYEYTDIDGCVSTRIEHGVARMAANCRCDCHADQVVTKTSFDVTMTVTLDVVEAFLRWCEENEYTQADFDPDGMGDDAFGDGEALAEWLSEQLLDDCGGDITGPGVLAYQSDVDGFEFDPLTGLDFAADVTAQAVSNWIARWEDFPAPLARFGNADVYPRDEVTDCLLRHGRSITWKEAS